MDELITCYDEKRLFVNEDKSVSIVSLTNMETGTTFWRLTRFGSSEVTGRREVYESWMNRATSNARRRGPLGMLRLRGLGRSFRFVWRVVWPRGRSR